MIILAITCCNGTCFPGEGLSLEVPLSDDQRSDDSEGLMVASGDDGLSVRTDPDASAASSEDLAIAEPPPISDWISPMKPLQQQGQALLAQLCRTILCGIYLIVLCYHCTM